MRKTILLISWFPAVLTTTACLLIWLYLSTKTGLTPDGANGAVRKPYQSYAALPQVLGEQTGEFKISDARVAILANYFHNSPLESYAELIIRLADKYGLDYRWTAAIAHCESNSGRRIPENSYNAWGYGVHSKGTLKFDSWENALDTFMPGFKNKFLWRTAVDKKVEMASLTPEDIMPLYTPASIEKGGSWAKCVSAQFKQLR